MCKMIYLFKFIISFVRSGVEVKRGVVFRHTTRNAFKNWAESGEWSVLHKQFFDYKYFFVISFEIIFY